MFEQTLPNGEKVTCLPLSAPQLFMYGMAMLYGGNGKYPINNIASGYYWNKPMDVETMKASIMEAVARCDTMRLRFLEVPEEAGVMFDTVQYIATKSEMEIEEYDFTDISMEEANEKLFAIARGPVPMFNCELHKIAIVKFCDGSNGIFMKIQHLAMDAYSVKIFLKDVMDIYLSKTQGKPYPKPMRPYLPVLIQELQYLQSDKIKEDYKYWAMSLATTSEPIFTDYMLENRLKPQAAANPGQRYANIHGGSPAENVTIKQMSAEESDAVMKMCEENGLSIAATLMMGLRTALSIFNDNEEDVSLKTIVNRRATVAEKKSGGIRINFFPMRSIIPADMTFAEAVRNIEGIQADIYKHCGLPFTKTLEARHQYMPKGALQDSTYDSTGFSYQPLMIIPNVDEETAKTARSVWYNNGATMIPFYMTARHRANDGGFEFVIEHKQEPDATYDIEVFYEKMRGALLMGAENPDVKVGDILEKYAITQEERDGKNK